MLYDRIKPLVVYNGKTTIPLPRQSVTESDPRPKNGYGNVVFLLTPNREGSAKLMAADSPIEFRNSFYRKFRSDTFFKTKIGTKNISKNEATQTRNFFKGKNLQMSRVSSAAADSLTNAHKNLVVDLGRWLDLYFSQSLMKSAKVICQRFAEFLSAQINHESYNGYQKLLLLDISQWVTSSGECIVMNKRLLTNPLAIILYTVKNYPQLLESFKGVTLFIVSSSTKQFLQIPSDALKQDKYSTLKMKLKLFKGVTFSAEGDEDIEDITDTEILAEQYAEERKKIFRKLKYSLLGNVPDADDEEALDIAKELEELSEALNDDSDDEFANDIVDAIDEYVDQNPDALDTKTEAEVLGDIKAIAKKKFIAEFMPSRTPKEEERIKRLTAQQREIVPDIDIREAKTKTIATEDMSDYIRTSNPNIKTSKFINFDHDYVEKKLGADIDGAIAMLSKASEPIFIESKEEIDSSTPMDIKKTLVYHLKDAKGNRSTLKFDVPVIIDNQYIFLNGSRKQIGHQFVLKPLSKTEPDTVQFVSWYNKIFIYRMGQEDQNTNKIRVYLEKNAEQYGVIKGSSIMKNKEYDTPLDFDVFSKFFYQFKIGDLLFLTEIDALIKKWKTAHPGKEFEADTNKQLPVAFDTKTKELLFLDLATENFTSFLMNIFTDAQKKEISKIKRKPRLLTARAKMLKKLIPLVLFLYYCEGFESVMKKAKIKHEFIQKNDMKNYDGFKWGFVQLEDGILAWDKTSQFNCLLMNELQNQPMELFSQEQLESKDTYRYLLSRYFDNSKFDNALDNYRDFLIDHATAEILADHGYPTDLVEVFLVAVRMLCDNQYKPENNMANMRIRSTEALPNIICREVTKAYTKYRATVNNRKPKMVSINPNAIINAFLDGNTTNLVADASSLNPVLELEKGRAVTFKGLRGIQLSRAMTLPRRGYDESMLGVVGISTSPDALVGVTRQLTLEPSITSTRGYIEPGSKADVNDLNSANLFTPAEMLTPLGVQHDDPDRTSIL